MTNENISQILLKRTQVIILNEDKNAFFWLVDLHKIRDEEIVAAKQLLGEELTYKFNDYVLKKHRENKIITYAILLLILHKKTKINLYDIKIARDSKGKPYLPGYPIHFNLSYAGKYAFIGVHTTKEIGVDIEAIQERIEYSEIIKTFHPQEAEYVIDAQDPIKKFFEIWCAKEAFLKSIGTGFITDSIPCLLPRDIYRRGTTKFICDGMNIDVYNRKIIGYMLAVCMSLPLRAIPI